MQSIYYTDVFSAPLRGGMVRVICQKKDWEPQVAHPDELIFAQSLVPRRAREWLAGRFVAHLVLEDAGLAQPHLPMMAHTSGAPVAPYGYGVSISHKGHVIAACAARMEAHQGIGVDIELVRHSRVPIERRILTPNELARLPEDPDARMRAIVTAFSLKEAAYKALNPLVHRYIGFQEVEVVLKWLLSDQHVIFEPKAKDLEPLKLYGRYDTVVADGVTYVVSVVHAEPFNSGRMGQGWMLDEQGQA